MHHHQFNIHNCTLCPHCIYVFCIYLRTNSDLCHLQHKLFGFYNRDKKCSQRGTDRVFKYSRLCLVFNWLKPNVNYTHCLLKTLKTSNFCPHSVFIRFLHVLHSTVIIWIENRKHKKLCTIRIKIQFLISIVKPNRCTNFRVCWILHYMFRTVFPSIIRSPRLYIRHQLYVIHVRWLHASGHEMEPVPSRAR